jgi:dipeptidyl aminopeptidase/acylaminoacyl peptidase
VFLVTLTQFVRAGAGSEPTLELIMREPDWIARSPERVRWTIDGSAIVFDQRLPGLVGRDLSETSILGVGAQGVGGALGEPVVLDDETDAGILRDTGVWNSDGSMSIVSQGGDLFLYSRATDTTERLTRTQGWEGSPMWMTDGSVGYWSGSGWFVRDSETGLVAQAADVRFEEDPEEKEEKPDYLKEQQERLFDIVRLNKEREEAREERARARRAADPGAVPGPFYLGKGTESAGRWLSPSGSHLIVGVRSDKAPKDKRDVMPVYVTDDGYVTTQRLRAKVGNETRKDVSLVLIDLEGETVYELDLSVLPMISDDPLAPLKAALAEQGIPADEASDLVGADVEAGDEAESTPEPGEDEGEEDAEDEAGADEGDEEKPAKARGVSVSRVVWSDSGGLAAVQVESHDNKDRWIALVDPGAVEPGFETALHERDLAWVGWGFRDMGFVPGTEVLWFLSEHEGHGHLYTYEDGEATKRTDGDWEVRDVRFTRDGSGVFMRTNRTNPGVYELERLDLASGELTALTSMGGTVESYSLSPDESRVVFSYSEAFTPSEVYLVGAEGGDPVKLTDTVSEEFESMDWAMPEFVMIPSSHGDQPIHTRVYRPDPGKFDGPRPVVIFVHGAGYLQDVFNGWSHYFREHMFHTILVNQGFVVLEPDYRHSEGYGRDWRTSVYRELGYKELEDFRDIIAWAGENANVDTSRVGIYGGSYGGFMTLMALFLEPETYTAGAAIRSVTDWMHYNHGWTSNILNTPQLDPEVYKRSSPIEHAEGLEGHLLILHGLVDDNVVAQDVIRLSQRLIELEKQNWEMMLYPIEPHGFREPSSWLDEYRRINDLFVETLEPSR